MDAVEDLAGLGDAAGGAARDLHERVLSGSINAGESQDGDGSAGARAEFLPGRSAARRARLRAEAGRGGVSSSTQAPPWSP
jgi:hypothetical protein